MKRLSLETKLGLLLVPAVTLLVGGAGLFGFWYAMKQFQDRGMAPVAPAADMAGYLARGLPQLLLVAGLASLAILLVNRLVLRTLVHKSVRQLVLATEKVATGDLVLALTPRSLDELGQLLIAFNNMTSQLAQLVEGITQNCSCLDREGEELGELIQQILVRAAGMNTDTQPRVAEGLEADLKAVVQKLHMQRRQVNNLETLCRQFKTASTRTG